MGSLPFRVELLACRGGDGAAGGMRARAGSFHPPNPPQCGLRRSAQAGEGGREEH